MNAADVAAIVREWAPGIAPRIGIILGSGLGALADEVSPSVRIAFVDLPGFPHSGVSSHRGELVLGWLGGMPVAVFAGRGHYYERGNPREMQVPIATLKALGADTLILTNAAGSLREDMGPGTPMLITDHINLTGMNPMIGIDGDARFVNLVGAYDRGLAELARRSAQARGISMDEGVYMWFSGPTFETPAEIRMARILGADAVGMSTVPETILARYVGLNVLAISMITNLGAGITGEPVSHEETKSEAKKGAETFRKLIIGILEDVSQVMTAGGAR